MLLKLAKLLHELPPSQQLDLGQILSMTINSHEERKNSNESYAFTQIPTTKKMINKISLKNKQSIMGNSPKPSIVVNSNFSVISPMHAIKNALMIGLDVAIIRASQVEEDLMKNVNNCISDGPGLKREIRDLAEKCMNLNDDLNILVFSEFRDGFSPCANLTCKDSLILHTFTLLPTDVTVDC